MQLAHAADDGLSGIRIGVYAEGGIFLRQLGQGDAHLFLVALGLRFDRHGDDRLGEGDGLKHDRVLGIGDGVTGGNALQADAGADVARVDLTDLFALVGMHLQQTADALTARGARIEHAVASL